MCRELIAHNDVTSQMGMVTASSLSNEGFDRALSLANLMAELVPMMKDGWREEELFKRILEGFASENAPCLELQVVACGKGMEKDAQKFAMLIATSLHSHIRAHAVDGGRALRRMLGMGGDKIRGRAEDVALNALCWVSPAESELAEMLVKAICALPEIPGVFQRVLFDLIARWRQKIDMSVDAGISGEVKTRAAIAIGRMLKDLTSVAELNSYRKAAVVHMKQTMADPLPFVEVDRAWGWLKAPPSPMRITKILTHKPETMAVATKRFECQEVDCLQ